MAAIKAFGATDQGQWFDRGRDKGKPVKYRIRHLSSAEERECRKAAFGDMKGRALGRQSAVAALERADSLQLEHAIRAFTETQNFYLGIEDKEAAEQFGKLLNVELAPGGEVCLDGKWTPDVRRAVLTLAQEEAGWIHDKSKKIVAVVQEEDEEDTEDF